MTNSKNIKMEYREQELRFVAFVFESKVGTKDEAMKWGWGKEDILDGKKK